jgi:hypothetical protein
MSAILSRPIDFDRTKQLVIETNNCLAKLALKRNVQNYILFISMIIST